MAETANSTETTNYSADIELVQGGGVALSACRAHDLEERTEGESGTRDEERWPSSKLFSNEHA
jgi:hypothetical protein